MSSTTDITELRKAGRLAEALDRARACYDAAPRDLYIQRAYGWVLYFIAKAEVEELEQQRMSQADFADRFPLWLTEFQSFGANERPGMLYSCLLNRAVKSHRSWSGFLEFARWWDPCHLRPEDREPFVLPNGKQAPSLEMRFFYAIGRELVDQAGEGDPELLCWAEQQLHTALERHPDDPWLNLYMSRWLLARGDTEQARRRLAPVLRRQRAAAWAWDALGQTYELGEPDKAIACWFHAVRLARRPQDVAGTRVRLADLLAQQQRFDEAAVQVHHSLAFRRDNGFKVPQELLQLAGSGWFRQRPDLARLPLEPDMAREARQILDNLDERLVVFRPGVVDHQNPQKSLAHVAFGPDEGVVLYYNEHAGADQLAAGQIVEVGQVQGRGRPVCFRPSAVDSIDDFCRRLSGEVSQRDGQSFGFMTTPLGERVFVPPTLMDQLSEKHLHGPVQCVAYMSKDRQGKPGWRALSWIQADALP
ncbi:tetratricopeptide repeat protein [uncultured Azohydromonas sp.]|jgi:Thioredoxin domain-containing protein|uniref:tetratricopeptide repeat protein n=1 Tax=uncultured Azohydromonas sp. TaxID=487342 RepID=UPI0026183F50|nr:tetratricopeptide repeat protein [uncultured Azohydromonas sp.]